MSKGIFIIVFIILVLPMSFALSSDIKPFYMQGETAVIEIKGNIFSLKPGEVEVKRKNVNVPVDFDVTRLGDKWFLWLITPEAENNYSITIRNVGTTNKGKVTEIDFVMNFSTTNLSADYSIKPGVIFAKDDFELILNSKIDDNIIIDLDFPVERQVTINPGKNTLQFDISNVDETGLINLNIGDYTIPAYIVAENKPVPKFPIEITPKKINRVIFVGDDKVLIPIEITNVGDIDLNDFVFIYNDDLFGLDANTVKLLPPRESFTANIVVKVRDNVDEVIVVGFGNGLSTEIPVFIEFSDEEIYPKGMNDGDGTVLYYCSELQGNICTAGEVCSGESISSLDGSCCIGSCGVEPGSDVGKIVGWSLAGIILIIILIVFIRYKRTKGRKSNDPLKKRVGEIEGKDERKPV